MKTKKRKRVYRRSDGSDTWHFHKRCQNMPTRDYIEKRRRSDGELCDECISKEKADDART